ncbi:MAG: family peptidase [Haloplasmataceae bacterium]|jgi:putative protease|nr:family peptidase [Haloplasmataceae bacterium]
MKLELTILPTSFTVIEKLTMCDAFIVGEEQFGLRLPKYFTKDEILKIIELCHKRNQKVYIALNKIVHEYELNEIDAYLNDLHDLNMDGIIFGDLSVYQLARKYNLTHKLIYNPETYITNYKTVEFFARKGIKRATIAKEITLEDINLIGSKKILEVEVLGHGAANMFHSMRDLVTNYFKFLKVDEKHINEELYMIEEKRDEKYPIIEDKNGTHVFSGYDLCTINVLDQLTENNISNIKIDGLFKDDDMLLEIVKVYHQAITDYNLDKELYLKNKANYLDLLHNIKNIRPFNEGFLFKKTIYKGGEINER